MNEQANEKKTGTPPRPEAKRSPEEKKFLEWLQGASDHPLSEQEKNHALAQAKQVGDL